MRLFDHWYLDLFPNSVDVEVLGRARPDETAAEMNDLGPPFFETLGLGHYLVGLIATAAAASIETDQFNVVVSRETAGPVAQGGEAVPASAVVALLLTANYAHFCHFSEPP
jgi:hypothetical protein